MFLLVRVVCLSLKRLIILNNGFVSLTICGMGTTDMREGIVGGDVDA